MSEERSTIERFARSPLAAGLRSFGRFSWPTFWAQGSQTAYRAIWTGIFFGTPYLLLLPFGVNLAPTWIILFGALLAFLVIYFVPDPQLLPEVPQELKERLEALEEQEQTAAEAARRTEERLRMLESIEQIEAGAAQATYEYNMLLPLIDQANERLEAKRRWEEAGSDPDQHPMGTVNMPQLAREEAAKFLMFLRDMIKIIRAFGGIQVGPELAVELPDSPVPSRELIDQRFKEFKSEVDQTVAVVRQKLGSMQ